MIALAPRLLGWGKIALRAAVSLATRYPLQCAIVALLCLSAWLWRGWNHERADRRSDAVAFQTASDEAKRQQAELRARETQAYKDKAHEADLHHAQAVADARDATARYVAAHRVIVSRGGQCAPVAVSEADPAGIREDLPGGAFVAVSEADVQRAAEWQTYALNLREWALQITGNN